MYSKTIEQALYCEKQKKSIFRKWKDAQNKNLELLASPLLKGGQAHIKMESK